MKKAWVVLLILLFASTCWAANTYTYGTSKQLITITGIATDWNWYDMFPDSKDRGVRIFSIRFNPGAAADRCVINDGSIDGAALFDSSVAYDTSDGKIEYYPEDSYFKPVIDASDGTYNAAAFVTIIFIR
jgi:hypothetical protein